jgi:hypothetical protein
MALTGLILGTSTGFAASSPFGIAVETAEQVAAPKWPWCNLWAPLERYFPKRTVHDRKRHER